LFECFLVGATLSATAAATTVATSSAAASATTVATSSATAATTASATTFCTGTRFIDVEGATHEILTVHIRNRGLCLGLGGHLYKSKPSRFACELVLYDTGGFDLAKGCKSLTQIVFGCLTRQIANIDIHSILLFLSQKKFQPESRHQKSLLT
jgi:hypothetical protein